MMLPLILAFAAAAPNCSYDRAALLALSEDQFDQDLTGGWRKLADQGCTAEAADMIAAYRDAAPRKHPQLLMWHEGQLRAILGQDDRAIALFATSYESGDRDTIGWNHYVAGTIAFIRHDRPALAAAREALAAVPPPPNPPAMVMNGKRIPLAWPPNLNVLDGFLKCFGKPYREAYASAACTVSFKITTDD